MSILWRRFLTKNVKIEKQKNILFSGIQSSSILQSLSSNKQNAKVFPRMHFSASYVATVQSDY